MENIIESFFFFSFIFSLSFSFLQIGGFLQEFVTPIIKATKKKVKNGKPEIKSFFTVPEYESWKNSRLISFFF
jgi:DNA topoisomerase-2